ncbi:hypothetical protein [Piscinibacter sp.]|jgi:predicted lipoprotein with Yx(FWY)xxD motif|uniref:COG4315 family predicted lipoprotein n=1 Tax=Piscinibacter sp. TaxID=1903157 RepID=UPI00355ABF0E
MMNRKLSHARIGLVALAIGALSACASMMQASAPAKVSDGALVGPNGMTLYTFDRDAASPGRSACNGPCVANWPPLMADGTAQSTGDWSVIARDDGQKQWAYKGKPLYFWAKDGKPGDKNGDGFNKVWHTATP